MKLTKNKDKYNLELNQHEANCLFTITSRILCGFHKVEQVNFELYSNLDEQNCKIIAKEKYVNYYDGAYLSFPDVKAVEKRDCSFLYPKSAYRNKNTNDIEHFEPRTLKQAYIKDDYLIGLDSNIKKFSLSKVKHLTWE